MNPVISHQWESLRKRLVAATKTRGSQAALAREYKVSEAAVSLWLKGHNIPSGDIALSLLGWVTKAERKQNKARGSATNTATSRKTLSTQSYEDQRKQGPRKS